MTELQRKAVEAILERENNIGWESILNVEEKSSEYVALVVTCGFEYEAGTGGVDTIKVSKEQVKLMV